MLSNTNLKPLKSTSKADFQPYESTSKGLNRVDMKFTVETADDFETGFLPTLDMQIRMLSNGEIIYKFYEKPMANQLCILESAAMAQEAKASILVQEVCRRLLNTSELIDQSTRDSILTEFDLKMERSGYPEDRRRDIMRRGMIKYERMRKEEKEGGRRLHRPAASSCLERSKKKQTESKTWWKNRNQALN